jgi:hypothetical protein
MKWVWIKFSSDVQSQKTTVESKVNAVTIAILDGVPYIESNNKMCKSVRNQNKHNIMSALVLREFLYSL